MLENARDPSKWILNYKFKIEQDSMSKQESELQDSCRLIESLVVKTRPRRHGKGKNLLNYSFTRNYKNHRWSFE